MKNASKWCASFCAKNPIPSGLKKYGAVKMEGTPEENATAMSTASDAQKKAAGFTYNDGTWTGGDFDKLIHSTTSSPEDLAYTTASTTTQEKTKKIINLPKINISINRNKDSKYKIGKSGKQKIHKDWRSKK